jgi:hypothetical protein
MELRMCDRRTAIGIRECIAYGAIAPKRASAKITPIEAAS